MRPSRSVTGKALPHTCIFCERRLLTKQNLLSPGWTIKTNDRLSTRTTPHGSYARSVPRKQFHSSRIQHLVENISLSTRNEPNPEYSFSVKPKQIKASNTSQIRGSLRAWSVQNQRVQQDAIPDTLPPDGKITKLPNALFLQSEREMYTIDGETHARDEQGTSWVDHDDAESPNHGGNVITPGTLFMHWSPLVRPQNVIYLGEIGVQSLLLLSDGSWVAEKVYHKRAGFYKSREMTIANFLSAVEVDKLRAHLPQRPVTRALTGDSRPISVDVSGTFAGNVAAPMIQKLKLHNNSEDEFLKRARPHIQQLYNLLAHEDSWRIFHLTELPQIALGIDFESMTDVEKKAFVSYTNVFHPYFIPTQTATTITYYVGPKSLEADVHTVREWSRSYQEAAAQAAAGKDVASLLRDNPLSLFIDKARRIIIKSRKIRSPTSMGVLGPSLGPKNSRMAQKVLTGEVFTVDDQKVIKYLWDIALRRPANKPSKAHAALIVRAIGAYPEMPLDQACVRMLLGEIGCIDPWTTFEDITVRIPGTRASQELDELQQKAFRSAGIATAKDPLKGTAPTKFPDSMAHLRKDWGQMSAFAIDEESSHTVEDAVCVEPASERDGWYWIHVHIAHPTAHFSPDHPIAKYARKLGAASYPLYEGERVQLMVPSSVVNQFSLTGNENPVLTVSTLLGTDGQVHDVKIVPGILRNLTRLSPSLVDEIMGTGQHNSLQSLLVVGKCYDDKLLKHEKGIAGPGKASENDIKRAMRFSSQLNLLATLLNARLDRREVEVETPARFTQKTNDIRLRVAVPEGYTPDRESKSYHWHGDPGIFVVVSSEVGDGTSSDEFRGRGIVASAMRLAGESAGKWLADRNIPATFLGNIPPLGFSVEAMNQTGQHTEAMSPIFVRSASPTPLVARNLKQYAAVTSPLRKFIDMFNTFQIDSYLKAQAQGFVEPGAPVMDHSILSYSKKDVEVYLAGDISASDSVQEYFVETRNFWMGQALFRAFHFHEAQLPEVMEVMITAPTRRNSLGVLEEAKGILMPFQFAVRVVPSPEGYELMATVQSWLPVKLEAVNPYSRLADVCAVGPPTLQPQLKEPITCINSEINIARKLVDEGQSI